MHLNEFAVRVIAALLIQRRLRRPGADHRIRDFAKDCANAAGGDNDRVRLETCGPPSNAGPWRKCRGRCRCESMHGGKKFPSLVFLDLAFGFVAPHLLVERVEKLLAGGGAGEGSAVVQRSAEAAEIEQTFGRAVKWHAHAIEQIDDAGRGLAHRLDRRLVGEKIAAVDGVVKVLPGGIAFALQVLGGVDSALRADGMRALDRDDGEEIDLAAHFGDLDYGRKACKPATYDDDFWIWHSLMFSQIKTINHGGHKGSRRKSAHGE